MKRTVLITGAVGVIVGVAFGVAVLTRNHADGHALSAAVTPVERDTTVACQGSTVELEFDPEGVIEARARGKTIASADAARRGLNYNACNRARIQRGWAVDIRYFRVQKRTTLTCRFPGRFSLHTAVATASWSGEKPAGSFVLLVLDRRVKRGAGPRRTILASASVLQHPDESNLMFAPDYCAA